LTYWERNYAIGALSNAACFGALCFLAFIRSDDAVSQLLIDATTVGYTAGVTARNSGRVKVAIGQLTLALMPLAIGAALKGGVAYYSLSLVTMLYLAAAVEISLFLSKKNLRLLLLNRENETLASDLAEQNRRFDIALSNMSHGLCMFDAQARLVVNNERMCELYDLPPGSFVPGLTVKEMVEKCVAAGNHADQSVAQVIEDYERHLSQNAATHAKIKLSNGRVISWTQRVSEGGGTVVIFEDITERERAEARAQYLSTHDGLTGLPNRLMFEQLLEGAVKVGRRYEKQFCVMFVDLDRFKIVNDTLGHSAGDILLKEVSERLKACLRDSDVVARLGGDEFVMILHDVVSIQQAKSVAGKIVACVAEPITIFGQECTTGASIGVAMFPGDAADEQSLIKCADAAMYLAKQEGKNGFRFFSGGAKTQSVNRLKFESELRRALDRNEFVLYYQPKRNIATGAISGVEALLRWRHPRRGIVAPDHFIHLAEETGLIVPIGKWVLETACTQNMAWQCEGLPEFCMAINLSPRQFSDEHLLHYIQGALAKSGMAANLLELEITESMLMTNLKKSEHLLQAIKGMGAHIAIDDFGAGYSSMARLKNLSIDTIKIDRSFIRGILANTKDQAIAQAIIALGSALNISVVAEGVETLEQEAFLGGHGCEQMQGFLFARPVAAADFAKFTLDYNLRWLENLSSETTQRFDHGQISHEATLRA
jgi:diguanylate cyclase (GGDEF)-like protein